MKATVLSAAATLLMLATLAAAASAGTHDFYAGKTIRFIVGFSPGGGFDVYTRLIARHFGNHVPGKPTVIVENMPGAASLIAANFLYNAAKPDVTIGNFIGPAVLQHALGNPAAKFDGRRFGWLGVPTPESGVCFLREGAGIKTVREWLASERPMAIGATGPGSDTHDTARLVQAAIGLPMKVVTGYPGTSKIRVAIDAGELDGGCWAWHSLKSTSLADFEAGRYLALVQTSLESHPDLKHVPVAGDYAKIERARELLRVVATAYGTTLRPYAVPPETAPDKLQILQQAFMDTLMDLNLQAEAKAAKMEINPVDGPTIAGLMSDLYELKPDIAATIKEIVLPKK